MIEAALARLLHVANSRPPHTRREEFYALKDRLLKRYAVRDGYHIQEIKKECWGYLDTNGCDRSEGCRCYGSGFYDHFFVRLEVYRWRGYEFHRPVERRCRPTAAPDIVGYIEHRDRGKWPNESVLWLCLLSGEWKLLRQLAGSCWTTAPWWMIGLQIQRLTFWLRQHRPQRCCGCDRWSRATLRYPHRCGRCQRALRGPVFLWEFSEGEDDGIPF